MSSDRTFSIIDLAKHTEPPAIYISVKGIVYDVTTGADFYGPGGGYSVFAGKDASRALGKMQVSAAECNCGWENLSEEHAKTLEEWVAKYKTKYPVVGTLEMDEAFVKRGAALEP
eukprot:PhM_4_TR1468/c0_g1_i1/m.59801/K17278/PGRMC1_2; membrane-associated progesterone receptor component